MYKLRHPERDALLPYEKRSVSDAMWMDIGVLLAIAVPVDVVQAPELVRHIRTDPASMLSVQAGVKLVIEMFEYTPPFDDAFV